MVQMPLVGLDLLVDQVDLESLQDLWALENRMGLMHQSHQWHLELHHFLEHRAVQEYQVVQVSLANQKVLEVQTDQLD